MNCNLSLKLHREIAKGAMRLAVEKFFAENPVEWPSMEEPVAKDKKK